MGAAEKAVRAQRMHFIHELLMSEAGDHITIDLGYCSIFSREDGIVQVNGRNHTYSAEELKQIIGQLKAACGGKRYPILIATEKGSMFDAAAIKYFSTRGLLSFMGPRAYVLRSRTQRMLAAIFLSSENNETPAKAFGSSEPAVEWLKEQA